MLENEKGYLLIEGLIGLLILATISYSLLTVLPLLAEANQRLDKEQAIYQTLFEWQDRGFEGTIQITEPFVFTLVNQGDQLCARYQWRDQRERTICL